MGRGANRSAIYTPFALYTSFDNAPDPIPYNHYCHRDHSSQYHSDYRGVGMDPTRRRFLVKGTLGLAAAGASTLVLRSGIAPTEASGELGAYGEYFPVRVSDPKDTLAADARLTEQNIQGPYYRAGAPYRAKITPPLEPGVVLLVKGRVWAHDSRRPLEAAVIDIWQANANGRYDNHENGVAIEPTHFTNRGRLVTDESGRYEFETVRPGAYEFVPGRMRPAHIHYWVRHPQYQDLITQLYFKGDTHASGDPFMRPSLVVDPQAVRTGGGTYELATFDVVLAPK
jgi:catechol 1,2-dioxygenase